MKTKWYRVALALINAAAIALISIDQWGPGLGVDPAVFGVIAMVGNLVVVVLRQVQDPTTPTVPTT